MDYKKTWDRVLSIIKNQVSPVNFKTWLSKTLLVDISGQKITISVPSAFCKGELVRRYNELISDSLYKVLGKRYGVDYNIDPVVFSGGLVEEAGELQLYSQNRSSGDTSYRLNPGFVLQNFVVGLTNNLAYAAAQAIIANPGTVYNPLFIYGQSGVGKTHLMQAIGNEIIKKNPHIKVIYAPSERFMNDFIYSIQTNKTSEFRQKYRRCDVFLIDDIQFISGKDSTQEEFFHTFNDLQSKNSQIVLTSDRPPNEMQRLEARLSSRFQGGLMVDIQLPDFDTRVAILRSKLKERGEDLPDEHIRLVAEKTESNTRELEGRLTAILQVTKLNNRLPDISELSDFLGNKQNTRSVYDYKKVLTSINQYFSIKLLDLIGPVRKRGFVLPRHIAMFLIYEDCKVSMDKIGEILGGRDHTTVLHGIDRIRSALKKDIEIQRFVSEVRQRVSE